MIGIGWDGPDHRCWRVSHLIYGYWLVGLKQRRGRKPALTQDGEEDGPVHRPDLYLCSYIRKLDADVFLVQLA